MAITCKSFTDFLSRRTEHLDDEILRDITPVHGWIGHVETGQFKAQDGVSHTYDRFNRVMPDLSNPWADVTAQSCIGQPCDPTETIIGIGFTRDSYKLQTASYATDLFCFDLILSADRAKQQFSWIVENLRDATSIIVSDRLKCEAFRVCQDRWVAGAGSGLTAFTYVEMGNLINVVPSVLPTSKLTARMLQRRVEPQILRGALGKNPKGKPPLLELVTDMTTLWELREGNSELTDHWRWESFDVGSEYYKYGWVGKIGNYAIRVDPHPIRFQINGGVLNRVFPYVNIAATQGIKGIDNPAYINAPVQAHFIWHNRVMQSLVRDTTSINPMMPFAARDFGGKWQFVMDNMVCKQTDGTLTPVDNTRRNKGKFIADFAFATKKMYPEFGEVILALREPACVVEVPPCADTPAYVAQDYGSHNDLCDDLTVVLPS